MPQCTIVLPVTSDAFNASLVRHCLNRLFAHLPQKTQFDILVVDFDGRGNAETQLADYLDRVRLVTAPPGEGSLEAFNSLAAQASSEYVLFLPSGVSPAP